jgi:hypothetical protein
VRGVVLVVPLEASATVERALRVYLQSADGNPCLTTRLASSFSSRNTASIIFEGVQTQEHRRTRTSPAVRAI